MADEQTETVNAEPEITEQTEKSDESTETGSNSDNAVKRWCLTYFWVGQKLEKSQQEQLYDESAPFHVKHRKLLSILIPLLITHIIWWSYAISNNLFHIFVEEINGISRYYMSITMVFGSFIAGATSEGGASVAFPVMTLAFGILPAVARDFSFMIQSVGMTAAAFTILFMRVKIEYKSIIYCSIGGIFGIIFCLSSISHHLPPPFSKMYFVSIWFSFAFSLFWLNRTHDRKVYDIIPKWDEGVIWRIYDNQYMPLVINWKALVLLFGGFMGGIFSGIAGSGIDICSFALLTLLFRVTEKTATPTSVVLMAINTCVGFFWRQFIMDEISMDSWDYFFVCIPIVVIGAPFGSIIGSHLHREVLAVFVYVTDTVQLLAALIIVKPWNISPILMITSVVFIIGGGIIFSVITRTGLRIMTKIEENGGDAEADGVAEKKEEPNKVRMVASISEVTNAPKEEEKV